MEESLNDDNFSESQRLLQARKSVAQGSMTIQQASTFFLVPETLIQMDSEENEGGQSSKMKRLCKRLYFLELKDGQLGENWVIRRRKLLSIVEKAKERAQALDILLNSPTGRGVKSKVARFFKISLKTVMNDYKQFTEFHGSAWYRFLKDHPIGYDNLVPKPSMEICELGEEKSVEKNDGTSKNGFFGQMYFLEFKDGQPGGEWILRRTKKLDIVENAKERAQALDMLLNNPIEIGMKSKIAGLLRIPLQTVIDDYRHFTERNGAAWYKFLKEHPIGYDNLVPKPSIDIRKLGEKMSVEKNSDGMVKKKKLIGHMYFLEFKDGQPGGEWVLRRTHKMKIVENAKARAQALDMIIGNSSTNTRYTKYVEVARICGLPVETVKKDYRLCGKNGSLFWYKYLKEHPMGYENLVPKPSIDAGEKGGKNSVSEGEKKKPTKGCNSNALNPATKRSQYDRGQHSYILEFADEGNPGQDWLLMSTYKNRVVKNAKQRALALEYLLNQGIDERQKRRRVAFACRIRPVILDKDWSNLKRDSLPFFTFLKNHPFGFQNLVGTFPGEVGSIVENREGMAIQNKMRTKKEKWKKKQDRQKVKKQRKTMPHSEDDEIVCLEKIKEEIIDLVEDEIGAKDTPSTSARVNTGSQIQIRIDKLKLSLVTANGEQQFITPEVSDAVVSKVKNNESVDSTDLEYELMNAEYYIKVKLCLDAIIREGKGLRFPCSCINLTYSQVQNIMELYHAGHFPWYLFKTEECKDLVLEKELAKTERLNTLKEMKQGLNAYLRKIAPCVPRSFDVNKLWTIGMKERETPKPSSIFQPDAASVKMEDADVKTSRTGRKVKRSAIARDFVTGTHKTYNPRKSKEKARSPSSEEQMEQEKATIEKIVQVKPWKAQKNTLTEASGSEPETKHRTFQAPERKDPLIGEPCVKNKQYEVTLNHSITSSARLPEMIVRESTSGHINEGTAEMEWEMGSTEAEATEDAKKAAEFLGVVAVGLRNYPVTVSVSELKCNTCSISFSYLFQLGDHLWAKHSIGQYQCPFCPAKSELTLLLYGHMICYHDTLVCQMCSSQERYTLSDFKKHVLESHSCYHLFFDIFCPSKASILRDMVNTDQKLKCRSSVCLNRVEETPVGKIFLSKGPNHQHKRKRSTSERGSARSQEEIHQKTKQQKLERERCKSLSDTPFSADTEVAVCVDESDGAKSMPQLYTCPKCDVSLFCTLPFFSIHLQKH